MNSLKSFLLWCVLLVLWSSFFYEQEAGAVLQKHFEAIGEQTLKQIQGVHATGRLQRSAGSDLYFKMYVKGNDRVRVEWSDGARRWVEVYSNGSGWSNKAGQVSPLLGQDLYNLGWLAKFMSPLRGIDPQQVRLGESTVDGEQFYNLQIDGGNSKIEYLVDKTSFLLAYQRLSVAGASDLVPQQVSYEKFKGVADARVATIFLIKTNDGTGEIVREMIFDDLVFGYPVPDSLFEL